MGDGLYTSPVNFSEAQEGFVAPPSMAGKVAFFMQILGFMWWLLTSLLSLVSG